MDYATGGIIKQKENRLAFKGPCPLPQEGRIVFILEQPLRFRHFAAGSLFGQHYRIAFRRGDAT